MRLRGVFSTFASFGRRLSGAHPGTGRERAEEPPETANELPSPIVITDDLDLHGFFPEQVPELLDEFLRGAQEKGIGEVRIAHGKGRSVLRRVVWEVLAKHPLVVDFRQAPPERGGWGATLARVSPRETSK